MKRIKLFVIGDDALSGEVEEVVNEFLSSAQHVYNIRHERGDENKKDLIFIVYQ